MVERSADRLLERLAGADADEPVVDLRDVDWVRPAMIVGVAALAHRAHAAGRSLAVRAPVAGRPAGYAARMRLGRVLDRFGASHDLPVAIEQDRHEDLIELSEIDGEPDVVRLARLVHRKVAPLDAELAKALHGSVGEIGANVPEHAGTIGFMAAQTLLRRQELLVAVGDAGVGMQATLARRGADSDERALDLAVQEHVSQFDEPDRGRGLPTAVRLVTGQRGSLYLASGTASVRRFAGTRRRLTSSSAYPGTIVEIRIRLGPGG